MGILLLVWYNIDISYTQKLNINISNDWNKKEDGTNKKYNNHKFHINQTFINYY